MSQRQTDQGIRNYCRTKSNLSHGKAHIFNHALTESFPLDSISKMTRPKNICTTKIYVKITSQELTKDMDLVLSKFAIMESVCIEMELGNVLSKEIVLTEQEFEFMT